MSDLYRRYLRITEKAIAVILPMWFFFGFRFEGKLGPREGTRFMCSQFWEDVLMLCFGTVLFVSIIPRVSEGLARKRRAFPRGFIDKDYWFPKPVTGWRTFWGFALIGLLLCGVLEILHAIGCGL